MTEWSANVRRTAGRPRTGTVPGMTVTLTGPLLPAGTRHGGLDGPWLQAFWFTVPGTVLSKSNHRRGDSRQGKSTWSAFAGYELDVKGRARDARPAGWVTGSKTEPVADRPRIVAYCFARTLLDTGNIDKSLLDAVQGPVMATDAQVAWSAAGGVRTSVEPGVLIAFARLAPSAGHCEVVDAALQLVRASTDLLR